MNTVHYNSPHLKNYQQEVLKFINIFSFFNKTAIPHVKNKVEDSLTTIASRLSYLQYFEV